MAVERMSPSTILQKMQLITTPVYTGVFRAGSGERGTRICRIRSGPRLSQPVWSSRIFHPCGPLRMDGSSSIGFFIRGDAFVEPVSLFGPEGGAVIAYFRKPSKGPDSERSAYDRLRPVHPKPEIRPAFPNQSPRGIVRPHQGKEDQKPDHMAWNGREDGVGEVSCRAEYDTYKKIEKKLGPQETLSRAVRQRKQGG